MINIASPPKHLGEISLKLCDKRIDILALNETRLDCSISDELVSFDDDELIRLARNGNEGGVCVYERCNINYQKVPNDLDAVSLKVKQAISQFFCYFNCLYRPFTKFQN